MVFHNNNQIDFHRFQYCSCSSNSRFSDVLYVEATFFLKQLQCTTIAIHPYDAMKVVDIVTNAVLAVGDFGDAIYLGVGVTNQYLSIQKLAGIDEPGLYYMNPSSGATSLVARG
jgi:hypothetical protein